MGTTWIKSHRTLVAASLLIVGSGLWAFERLGERLTVSAAVPANVGHVASVVRAPPDEQPDDPAAANFTEVKFMMRGYCHAASQAEDKKAFGGFGRSSNDVRRVLSGSPGHGLYLLAQPGVVTSFAGRPAMRVVLVNQTDEVLEFRACDSRIAVIQEARHKDGDWKPIEYLPSSWCGNSHHRAYLKPNYYWQFAAPRYRGPIAAKLRFALKLSDGATIYSNEFDGSVHPEQFTIKQGHAATNLMDPYAD